MDIFIEHTQYPCCKGDCRLEVNRALPKQRYARRCPRCGQKWDIVRTLLLDKPGMRFDRAEWESEQ